MIVSLDDQLEWQESSKSHSPRTPTAPEALHNLRKNSPMPTPSRGAQLLKSPEALQELSTASGIDAIEKLGDSASIKSSRIVSDSLVLKDGFTLPLQMLLPVQIRTVERAEDGAASLSESYSPLTVGAAWLSLIADNTYESQLASLLRSRKNLDEICLDDRQIVNRYLHGNLTLKGLMASRLWTGKIDDEDRVVGEAELAKESDDALSTKLRKRNQASLLEERRSILNDQQNRLRRLLARELQRQHSTKSNPPNPLVSAIPPTLQVIEQANTGNHVVSSMLGKPAVTLVSDASVMDSRPAHALGKLDSTKVLKFTDSEEKEASLIRTKLKCLKIEWYRLCWKLRTCEETEKVLERRVKRMRYVRFMESANFPHTRLDLADALKIVE